MDELGRSSGEMKCRMSGEVEVGWKVCLLSFLHNSRCSCEGEGLHQDISISVESTKLDGGDEVKKDIRS